MNLQVTHSLAIDALHRESTLHLEQLSYLVLQQDYQQFLKMSEPQLRERLEQLRQALLTDNCPPLLVIHLRALLIARLLYLRRQK